MVSTKLDYTYGDKVPKLFGVFIIVALLGWLVSTFLSGIHFWALPLPEGVEPSGSLEVITSDWGYIFGLPLAFLGALYYLTVLSVAGAWVQNRSPVILKGLTLLTATGVVFSAFFVWLQLGPIGEICPFCMVSAAASTTLFILELYMVKISSLPSFKQLLPYWRSMFTKEAVLQFVFIFAVGFLVIVGFYGATLAPVPG